jgi:hypothetical protein
VRISDERYRRDLRRLQLAWSMIRLSARTPTIQRWTALSVYRIRSLRSTYAEEASRESALKGVTPFRVEFFSKSTTLRCEAALLAGFLRQFDVLSEIGDRQITSLPSLDRGENFVRAYNQFRVGYPRSEITFEHAVMLLNELARGVELALATCASCGAFVVFDRLSVRGPRCAYCSRTAQGSEPEPSRAPAVRDVGPNEQSGQQGSLF